MPRAAPLALHIAPGDPRPIVRQIVDGIRMHIATGELQAGEQLPSVRGLAQQLMINPNTVAKAYSELTSDGWLDARPGLGLFVAMPRQRLSDEERQRRLDDAIQTLVHEVIALGYTPQQALTRIEAALKPLQLRRVHR